MRVGAWTRTRAIAGWSGQGTACRVPGVCRHHRLGGSRCRHLPEEQGTLRDHHPVSLGLCPLGAHTQEPVPGAQPGAPAEGASPAPNPGPRGPEVEDGCRVCPSPRRAGENSKIPLGPLPPLRALSPAPLTPGRLLWGPRGEGDKEPSVRVGFQALCKRSGGGVPGADAPRTRGAPGTRPVEQSDAAPGAGRRESDRPW